MKRSCMKIDCYKRTFLLFLYIVATSLLQAQNASILSGKVVDTKGDAMSGVNIIAYNESDKQLGFTISNSEGRFSLKSASCISHVKFSFLGYKTQTIPYKVNADHLLIKMEETSFQLKEVAVRPERITERGDTLTYAVSSFKQVQDRSIADVIKKMPGLEVKSNGSIVYQGKAINKFYIEGLDLMGSQYAVASNNIKVDQVKDVQVLENHQAVKSLRGINFSEQAALNIVLKEDAKAVWAGLADLGAGVGCSTDNKDFLYENRLLGMNFQKNFQTLMMYKNTNTGSDIANEVLSLSELEEYRAESNMISMLNLNGPAFEENRYTFNKSHLLSGNWLWKTGKSSDLRAQVSGLIDQENQQRNSSTTYLDLNGMPVISEDWDVVSKRKEVKGEITYTLNGDQTYLKTTSKVYADWNVSDGKITYNDRLTNLNVKPYKRMASEDLTLSHTTDGGNVIRINSSTGYTYLPGQLLTINNNMQLLDLDLFSTKNKIQYQKRFGKISVYNDIGFNYQNQKVNQTHWHLEQLYWTPSVRFYQNGHEMIAGTKISYVHQSLKQLTDQSQKDASPAACWVEPYLNWRWKISQTTQLLLDYHLSASPYDAKSMVTEPLFVSFAQSTTGINAPDTRYTHALTGSFTYRNPIYGLFMYLRPTYMHNVGNILYNGSLESDIYVLKATEQRYHSDNFILDGRIAKNFFWASTTIGLGFGMNSLESQQLVEEELAHNRMNLYRVSFDYSLRPLKGLTIEGVSQMIINQRKEKTAPYYKSSLYHWSHSLGINYNPIGGWYTSLNNELYHSNEKSFGVNYFCDLFVGYKAKRWEMSLQAKNLIGKTKYEQVQINSATRFYTMTRLRPREIVIKMSVDL